MKYTAIYPDMIVHKAGCADITKQKAVADTTVTREASNLNAFLDRELADDLGDMGYTRDDFILKPCAK